MGQTLYQVAESGATALHDCRGDHSPRMVCKAVAKFSGQQDKYDTYSGGLYCFTEEIQTENNFKSNYSITVGNSTPKEMLEGSAMSGASKRENSMCKVMRQDQACYSVRSIRRPVWLNLEGRGRASSCTLSRATLSLFLLTFRFYPRFLRKSLEDFNWGGI